MIQGKKLSANIRLFEYVDDKHLAKLYRCSIGFVYPSQYEGFGIPPLEAMSCGTPVIACQVSSIPEVVGDAALLITPGDVSELTDVMTALLLEPALREQLIENGRRRASLFNWDSTASKTLDIYRSLVK